MILEFGVFITWILLLWKRKRYPWKFRVLEFYNLYFAWNHTNLWFWIVQFIYVETGKWLFRFRRFRISIYFHFLSHFRPAGFAKRFNREQVGGTFIHSPEIVSCFAVYSNAVVQFAGFNPKPGVISVCTWWGIPCNNWNARFGSWAFNPKVADLCRKFTFCKSK